MSATIPIFSGCAMSADVDCLIPVQRVLASQWFVLGPEVSAFESEFAAYCGVEQCVTLANGTDALELALRALEVKAGDKVLLAANAGFYGSKAVRLIGAVPQYVDIDPKSLTMSVASLQAALTVKPKGIVVTHLYGQLADIEAIVKIAKAANVPVIEDCAQAHGARRNGRTAGSFGDIGCFSFYPTKNLGALGDGGAVVTRDAALAARLKKLRQYGWGEKYHVELAGGRNSRLDEIQAAILRQKLGHLDRWNEERRVIARAYNVAFAHLPITCPISVDDDFVAHLYVVRVAQRQAFQDFLKEQGIATAVHYPIPDHHQFAYPPDAGAPALPATEEACQHVVSLPCFPGLKEAEVARVIRAVEQYFERS
jgi:aminotransferase EvaB